MHANGGLLKDSLYLRPIPQRKLPERELLHRVSLLGWDEGAILQSS